MKVIFISNTFKQLRIAMKCSNGVMDEISIMALY